MNRSRERQQNRSVSTSLDDSEHELMLTLPRHLRPPSDTISTKDRKSKSTKNEKHETSKKKMMSDKSTQSSRRLTSHGATVSTANYPTSPGRPSRSLTPPPRQKLHPGPRVLLLSRSVSESDVTVAWSNVSKPKQTDVVSKMLTGLEIGTPCLPSMKRTSSCERRVAAGDKQTKGGKAKYKTDGGRHDLNSLMQRSMQTISKGGSNSSSRHSIPASLNRAPSVNGKHTTLIFTAPKK